MQFCFVNIAITVVVVIVGAAAGGIFVVVPVTYP